MKKIALIIALGFITSLARAQVACQFPILWVDQNLCLETDQAIIEKDLLHMSSLLEGEIVRQEQTQVPVYFADKGEFVSKKKLKKSLNVLLSFLKASRYSEFLMVNRSLELNYVEMIPYHYPVNREILKYFRLRFSPEEARGTVNAQVHLPTMREELAAIPSLDLRLGFKRSATDIPDGKNCKYDEAKTNYGTHPGFTLKCNKKKIKVKFGEIHSEPFASRIFWALGLHADAVDYLPNVTLPYDQKIFTEFNSRRLMKTRFQVGPFLTKELPISLRNDPFAFIQALELKDGSKLSGIEARKFLVGNSKEKILTKEMIIAANEKLIVKVHTGPVQVQVDDETTSFGPWSWSEFGVEKTFEARSTLLLAAWLNWFDCRLDNNRLRLIEDKGNLSLQHVISDLGGVLGKAGGNLPFLNSSDRFKAFDKDFIKVVNGEIRFPHYRPINSNEAFNQATKEDLAFMAQLILALTPVQLQDALEAAGFSSAEVQGFKSRLLKRQQEIRNTFTVSKP